MTDTSRLLDALRRSSTWEELANTLGLTLDEARAQVAAILRERVPASDGETALPGTSAKVTRDEWGIPTVRAGNAADAYLGLGFAMGQDRLWQLDYLRRSASGTLSEVIGPSGLEGDRLSRTLNLRAVAETGTARLTGEVRESVKAFCHGVNLARAQAEELGRPFEFELLDYWLDPWTPVDTLVVLRGFWWQLTGRFPILCVPDQARRFLGEGPLLEEFFAPEGGQETIWPRGVPYPDFPRWTGELAGAGDDPDLHAIDPGAVGSNNWVIGPRRSTTGMPVLASDPHVPFALPSVWYEARLSAPGLDARGAMYAGVPGIFFGRNANLAWGLTNNISTLRDLYVEVTDDFDPHRYRRGTEWKGMTIRHELIAVRGQARVALEVREVDHGPVVTEVLPPFMPREETVSLRWVGHEPTEELEAMLGYHQAHSVAEFREHLSRWSCPTFNFMVGDRSGEIGYQLTGKLPLRRVHELGLRPGEDPRHAWAGYVPYSALPAVSDPPEGWLGSANNIVVTDEWPYPLSGTWPSDYRMQRLVEFLNRPGEFSPDDMAALQSDRRSPRALEWAGPAVEALRSAGVQHALLDEVLDWDRAFEPECRPACVFEAFFLAWARSVLNYRFPADMLPFLFPVTAGLVERLWVADRAGWFRSPEDRLSALRGSWDAALTWLTERMGSDPATWRWDRIRTLTLHHPLATTPLRRELLERGPLGHGGTWNTLDNGVYQPDRPFETFSGVSYRLLVDLAGGTRAVNSGGQSGHPGSPHYADQLDLWVRGEYHSL